MSRNRYSHIISLLWIFIDHLLLYRRGHHLDYMLLHTEQHWHMAVTLLSVVKAGSIFFYGQGCKKF